MEKEILAAFEKWNQALQSGDPKEVAKLYLDNGEGILLPTVSPKVRHNREEIANYFEHFLQAHPVGRITEHNIRIYDNIAINSGLYTFEMDQKDGTRADVEARFTFVYKKVDGKWMIAEHHSSLLPQAH